MSWLKEITIFFVLFMIMAFGMHPDLLSDPFSRVNSLLSQGAYWHPFLFTLGLYLLLALIRYTAYKLITFIRKNKVKTL